MNRTTDYLERLFIEELNAEGEVLISGIRFSRDEISYTLDPEAYKDVFEDWKIERKQRNILTAKQLLNIADNKTRFNTLKNIFKKHRIIPFVGAGMSIPSGFPSWRDFLYEVQKESGAKLPNLNNISRKGNMKKLLNY